MKGKGDTEMKKLEIIKKRALFFAAGMFVAAMVSVTPAVRSYAENGNNFAETGTKPLAVTVTFYDDYDSRGWCWTTTSPVASPVVQVIKGTDKSLVDWSDAETLRAATSVTDGAYYTHKAYKTDMEEGEYLYRVGDGSVWSETGSVRIDDGADGFTFLFTTDPQDYDETGFSQWASLVEKAYETCPEAVFMANGGDIVNNSHDALDHDMDQWIYAMDLPKENFMNSVFMPAAGNHDSWATSFTDRFAIDYQGSVQTGGYYTFTYGDMFFAVLNTNESGSGIAKQAEWLSEQLENTDKTWKIVMEHKGLISTGDHSNESDVAAWREALLPVMAKYQVDMMLQGHDHVYVRSKPYLYGRNGDGYYNGRTPNMEETLVTEIIDGKEITYSVEPSGTFYVTANYAGRKSYAPVDYDKTLIYPAINPYNGKAMSIEIKQQMFTSIRIEGNSLQYNAYTFDGENAEVYDTYNIKKNTFLPVEEMLASAPDAADVTVFDTPVISSALEEYCALVPKAQSALKDESKSKIEGYSALPLDDYEKAYPVAMAIENSGRVEATAEFSKKLKELKALYADLNEQQQALVENYGKIAEMEAEMLDIHAASAVTEMIRRYKEGLDGLTIEEVRLAYNALDENQKRLVEETDGLDLSFTPSDSPSSSCNGSMAGGISCMAICSVVFAGTWIRRKKKI